MSLHNTEKHSIIHQGLNKKENRIKAGVCIREESEEFYVQSESQVGAFFTVLVKKNMTLFLTAHIMIWYVQLIIVYFLVPFPAKKSRKIIYVKISPYP